MPTTVPVITHNPGDVFPASDWNSYLRDNLNKLLSTGHRVLTVAQFAALTTPEGTKGAVAPDEVYLEVDATNGILWHLAYESGEATYKWRFIGGRPMFSEVTTGEATSSTTYAALATAGPSVALPRAGDYDVDTGNNHTASGLSGTVGFHSYDIGGTGAVDADALQTRSQSGNGLTANTMRRRRKAGLTTVTLTSKYRASAAQSTTFQDRWMSVTPTRIRHDA